MSVEGNCPQDCRKTFQAPMINLTKSPRTYVSFVHLVSFINKIVNEIHSLWLYCIVCIPNGIRTPDPPISLVLSNYFSALSEWHILPEILVHDFRKLTIQKLSSKINTFSIQQSSSFNWKQLILSKKRKKFPNVKLISFLMNFVWGNIPKN